MTGLQAVRAALATFVAMLAIVAMAPALSAGKRPPLKIGIAVTANPLEGPPRIECDVSEVASVTGIDWWISFGRADQESRSNAQPPEAPTACHVGVQPQGSRGVDPDLAPYLIVRVRTSATFLPLSLNPDSILLLNVMGTLEKFAGFGGGGEPTYEKTDITRSFHLLDERQAVIPLLIANDAEKAGLGVRELFLKVVMTPASNEGSAAFGSILILSRLEGRKLVLDGGGVISDPQGDESLIRHIRPGLHTLGISDASGRILTKPVVVLPERTVVVDPEHADRGSSGAAFRLDALGKNASGHEEYRRPADGAVVAKIPAGEFLMGNVNTERTPHEHVVVLSEFLIDKLPVTWGQFKQFAAATGTPLPPDPPYWGIHDDHPANYVTWEEATMYCGWAGARLPTEAEREKAARGTDKRKYPWGDAEPEPTLGVFRHNWGSQATEPVGTHPAGASPYGLLDMGGNVWEYCSDWYDDGYYENSPRLDPKGPATGVAHVVRGGSWDSRPTVLSASCRNWGPRGYREGDFGFRCAMNSPGATRPPAK
jgi:formylglycine-generating enzyme required for sulfatase activity